MKTLLAVDSFLRSKDFSS